MNFNTLKEITRSKSIFKAVSTAYKQEDKKGWRKAMLKFMRWLKRDSAGWSVMMKKGNSKQQFLSFSSLPEVSCPGAGACLKFCYSFRAWRYPDAFFRQLQNYVLMQTAEGRAKILEDLDKYKSDKPVDFRLYVDGDFANVSEVTFWMEALKDRPWLKAYGYSKSWEELLAYKGEWPSNYKLNLSSGSKHDAELKAKVKALPVTRGSFVAVDVGYKVTSDMHGDRKHQSFLRKLYGIKAFTCPGKCNTCTPKGHACGSDRFQGMDIIIATH